jgi:hypothetical protein
MSEAQLASRLERLERDNRRLKGFAAVALVLAAALAAIYASGPTPQKFTAHEFDVVDDSGAVRVKLDASKGEPEVVLLDSKGNRRVVTALVGGLIPAIALLDAQGMTRMQMDLTLDMPTIALIGAQGNMVKVGLDSGEPDIVLSGGQGNAAEMALHSGEPDINLFDGQGKQGIRIAIASGKPEIWLRDAEDFEMDLGSINTVALTTGQTQRTSAASIMMFGNDNQHHVIWRAP